MRRGLTALLAVAAAALTGVPAPTFAAPAAPFTPTRLSNAGPNPITFGVPTVMDPIHPFGEPDIAVDLKGGVYSSGPAGTGTQRSLWEASVDGGQTFRIISPGPPPNAVAGSNAGGPGGGDTDINFDHVSRAASPGGRMYFADLYALFCLRVAESPDGGKTAAQNTVPGGCAANPAADRQWLAVYDPPPNTPHNSAYQGTTPLIYLEYNNLGVGPQAGSTNGASSWTKSNDGLIYTQANGNTANFGADGYPAIDQVTGKVFQTAGDGNGHLSLNIGTPQADGNLCFLDDAQNGGATGTCPKGTGLITIASAPSPDILFTVASMDSARNLYVVWGNGNPATPVQRQIFVSASPPRGVHNNVLETTDTWDTWTPPVQVSDASSATGDRENIFPWIKAGGAGMADAVWYGDASALDPSSTSPGHVWNVFMSQLVFPTDINTGALTGGAPTTQLVKVTPHPMDYLDVCLSGTGCIQQMGNRNLADFFNITIDNTGAAEIVYDDMSNGLIQQPFANSNPADHAGAALVTIGRQNGGPGLLGAPVFGSNPAPTTSLNDIQGDALFPVIGGTNVDGMDILQSSLTLSGGFLDVTLKVANLTTPATTIAALAPATMLHYITRWQMGKTIYYAGLQRDPSGAGDAFYAGPAQTSDACSVSACDPHVMLYPESTAGAPSSPVNGADESSGSGVNCPQNPSANNPCTILIHVNVADIGSPTASSLLEEVGGYAFASTHPMATTTLAQTTADNVPLEIDGICCYNFQAQPGGGSVPEFPAPAGAVLVALALVGAVPLTRRLRQRRA